MKLKKRASERIGERFYRLTIISIAGKTKKGSAVVRCKCECGREGDFVLERMQRGETKSCGCLKIEILKLATSDRPRLGRERKPQSPESKWESQTKWRLNNPDKVAAAAARFRANHPEVVRAGKAAYYQKRKCVIIGKSKFRFATDPIYRLELLLRSRINKGIRTRGGEKAKGTLEILGCSFEDARLHIESQFVNGMNWDSFKTGEIHLDHILPIASFDLTKEDEIKRAFSIKNLQPLWCVDNLRKSDKMPDGSRARSTASRSDEPSPISPGSNTPVPSNRPCSTSS